MRAFLRALTHAQNMTPGRIPSSHDVKRVCRVANGAVPCAVIADLTALFDHRVEKAAGEIGSDVGLVFVADLYGARDVARALKTKPGAKDVSLRSAVVFRIGDATSVTCAAAALLLRYRAAAFLRRVNPHVVDAMRIITNGMLIGDVTRNRTDVEISNRWKAANIGLASVCADASTAAWKADFMSRTLSFEAAQARVAAKREIVKRAREFSNSVHV